MGGSLLERPVLVTGAGGFVGAWLVRRLRALGAEPIAPARAELEVTDAAAVGRLLRERGVGHVFHLAATATAAGAAADPHEAFRVNAGGTWAVLDAARGARDAGADVRVVVASSGQVYGAGPGAPWGEDRPLDPGGAYDASKACADLAARSYAASFAMPVAVVRPANVYGGGDMHADRLVPGAALALAAGEAPVLRSDGSPRRDFLYVEDAVDAYLRVAESLERPELWGRAWNAGSGAAVAVGDVVRRLVALSGRDVEPRVEPRGPALPGDVRCLDASAIRAELGWRPTWSLDDGLAATWRWYEAAARAGQVAGWRPEPAVCDGESAGS